MIAINTFLSPQAAENDTWEGAFTKPYAEGLSNLSKIFDADNLLLASWENVYAIFCRFGDGHMAPLYLPNFKNEALHHLEHHKITYACIGLLLLIPVINTVVLVVLQYFGNRTISNEDFSSSKMHTFYTVDLGNYNYKHGKGVVEKMSFAFEEGANLEDLILALHSLSSPDNTLPANLYEKNMAEKRHYWSDSDDGFLPGMKGSEAFKAPLGDIFKISVEILKVIPTSGSSYGEEVVKFPIFSFRENKQYNSEKRCHEPELTLEEWQTRICNHFISRINS